MSRRFEVFDHRSGRRVDDDVAFDARGVIRDGFGLRVPMEFMDSIQRQVADAKRRKTVQYDPQGCVKSTFEEEVEEDAMTFDAAMHRPGYRYATDASVNDAAVKAYNDSVREMCNAWRTVDQPAPHGDKGASNSNSDAVPRTMDAATAQRIRDQAWEEMCERQRNAWETKP